MPSPGLNEITTTILRNRSMDDNKYEGSAQDMMSDYTAARRKGITPEQYEGSATDRIADAAGERRMKGNEKSKASEMKSEAPHMPGTPASKNQPKVSHGYGHPASARSGKLRMSGHSGAHRIGKRK